MKKFSKVLAIICVAIFTLFAFAACAPSDDPEKALQSLKDNGYTVGVLTKTVKTSDAFEYDFDEIEEMLAPKKERGTLEAVVVGTKFGKNAEGEETVDETVTIFYFSSTAAMKKRWDSGKIYIQEYADDDENLRIGKSGKMIYVGTKAAIKAARG